MPSIEELGQKVKAKYPGAYDDLNDANVGRKVKVKFPGAYDDFTEASAAPTPAVKSPAPTGGVLKNVAIGAAKGLGSTIAGASSLGEKMLQAPIKAFGGQVSKPLGQQVHESGVLEAQGAAQKFGKGAEQIAEFFAPGGAVGKTAKAIEGATGIAKGLEEAAGVAKLGKGLGRLAVRSGLEASVVGGQTAIQQGEFGQEAKTAALGGAPVPIVSGAVKGVAKVVGAEPERLIGKALGFTKSQVAKIDKIAQENGAYKGLKDFALTHGFGGGRPQIAQQIEERFSEMTKGNKPDVLAAIKELTPNKFKTAFEHLRTAYSVSGQETALAEINALSKKKNLTAGELDKVRSLLDATLPQGAYKGAEPVKTEGLQNLVDPIRRRLELIDKSGTIRRVNQDIRVLYQMMKAAETSKAGNVETVAAFRTALRSGAAAAAKVLGVPIPTVLSVPYVIYQGATDIPEVASYVAAKLRGATTQIPEKIPSVLKKALGRWK